VDSTGFGLYIVKNIIEGHGGKVWAESEGAGKGSRFIVELPVV
jgi:signal transduction histidine kinase